MVYHFEPPCAPSYISTKCAIDCHKGDKNAANFVGEWASVCLCRALGCGVMNEAKQHCRCSNYLPSIRFSPLALMFYGRHFGCCNCDLQLLRFAVSFCFELVGPWGKLRIRFKLHAPRVTAFLYLFALSFLDEEQLACRCLKWLDFWMFMVASAYSAHVWFGKPVWGMTCLVSQF